MGLDGFGLASGRVAFTPSELCGADMRLTLFSRIRVVNEREALVLCVVTRRRQGRLGRAVCRRAGSPAG